VTVLRTALLTLEDGAGVEELPGLLDREGPVDLLALLECRGSAFRGQRPRYALERLLDQQGLDRSFVNRSTRGILDEIVLVHSQVLKPTAHYTPALPDVFHDQVGVTVFDGQPLGMDRDLHVATGQWLYCSGTQRMMTAEAYTRYAAPGLASLLLADLNTYWPDCPGHTEPIPNWQARPRHRRSHKTLPPGARPYDSDGREHSPVADRRATIVLAEAGFVSAGCAAGDMTSTARGNTEDGKGGRIDHIVASPYLATAYIPGSYRVHVSATGDALSNHRLVRADYDLSRAGTP
jgi:hypothetical protein